MRYRYLTTFLLALSTLTSTAHAQGQGLTWGSYLGGWFYEGVVDMLHDPVTDEIIVIGFTWSIDYPTTAGAYDQTFDGGVSVNPDVFISRFAADGTTLVQSTLLGGSGAEYPTAAAFDEQGKIVLTGYTGSADFPITPGAYSATPPESSLKSHGFVCRLSPDLSQLEYSTYIGGTDSDSLLALAVGSGHDVYLTGNSSSWDFPVTAGAYDTVFGGGSCGEPICDDAVIVHLRMDSSLAPAQQLRYATFLGTSGISGVRDVGLDIAYESDDIVVVAGATQGGGFPTTPGAYMTDSITPSTDVFIVRMNLDDSLPSHQQLIYSTLLGGSNIEWDIALSPASGGTYVVSGGTLSKNFPTTLGAYDTIHNGPSFLFGDVFVSWLLLDASVPPEQQLRYSTFVGGSSGEFPQYGRGLTVDSADTVTIVGTTFSTDFPTTAGAHRPEPLFLNQICTESFMMQLRMENQGESDLRYSSYFGGSCDFGRAVTTASRGQLFIGTDTNSHSFPVTDQAYDLSLDGQDATVSRFDPLPLGVSRYGSSSASNQDCAPEIAMSVSAIPNAGSTSFAVTSTGGPANASGVVLIGAIQDLDGSSTSGIQAHVAFDAPFAVHAVQSDATGYAELQLDISPNAADQAAYGQFVWVNECNSSYELIASDALRVEVQSVD